MRLKEKELVIRLLLMKLHSKFQCYNLHICFKIFDILAQTHEIFMKESHFQAEIL